MMKCIKSVTQIQKKAFAANVHLPLRSSVMLRIASMVDLLQQNHTGNPRADQNVPQRC